MHYIKQFEDCKYDQFKTWKIIREHVYTSKTKNNHYFPSLNFNNQEIDDPYTVTEAFNEFFCSVANKVQQTLTKPVIEFHYKTYLTTLVLSIIYLDLPTPHEIYNIIVNLTTRKSTGADEISPFFVRKLPSVLSPYLCFYFPLHSNLKFLPVVLKLLELFQPIRQDPKTK